MNNETTDRDQNNFLPESKSYRVKLKVFEGPFDLLLHLIKINEMDIYDIPIAEITRQYLEYIELMEQLDLDVAGEFLVMAATLLNLKARSLLPETPAEEDEAAVDEILSTKELIRQLVEYRKFKEVAEDLRRKQDEQSHIFYRDNVVTILPAAQPQDPSPEDLKILLDAFSRVLRFVEPREYLQVIEEPYTVEEKIQQLRSLLERETLLSLVQLFRRCSGKQEMIVTFLALLELCRIGEIALEQSVPFTDITIQLKKPQRIDVPNK
jgi:segregation and condensation protein A